MTRIASQVSIRCPLRRGLSLIDCMLAMVVLTGIAAAAMRAAASSASAQIAAADRNTASRLAEALLAEINSRPWGVASITGSSRSNYADLWQYNGLDEAPRNRSGTDLTSVAMGTWRQTVTLEYILPSNRAATSSTATLLTRITVKVYKNGAVRATRVAYRAKDG